MLTNTLRSRRLVSLPRSGVMLGMAAGTLVSAATAALPPLPGDVDDEMVRFHGRGDVLLTAEPFNACPAFPGGGHAVDPGDAIHARLRIRLAPESEYEILDTTNGGAHTPGRILWNQGIVDTNHYAGMTIAYRHDTQDLYFVVGDSGPTDTDGDERVRMWRVNADLDDGVFRTIDWGYDEASGKAACWIDGVPYSPVSVVPSGSTVDSPPLLNGTWSGGGSIGAGVRSEAMYTLAGRGWSGVIGGRDTVWPAPNGPSSTDQAALDENTSLLGDVSYAAFRWANPNDTLGVSPWDVELRLDNTADGAMPTDSASGLDSQELISAEPAHDTIPPSWIETAAGDQITEWAPGDLPNSGENMQPRQLMVYHHGLGDQGMTVTELELSGGSYVPSPLDRSLVCCIGPKGEIVYWAIRTHTATDYSIVGDAPLGGVHRFDLPAGEPGVYRVIVKSTNNEGYAFETNQEALYWGAYAPFSHLRGVDGLPATGAHAYVPTDSTLYDLWLTGVTNPLEIATDGATSVLDDNWDSANNKFGSPESFGATTELLSMDLAPGWSIEARRFPFVLCNTRYAARHYIRAGVTETQNYTIWSPDDGVLRDRIAEIEATGLAAHGSIVESFASQETHILSNYRDYFSLGDYPQSLPSIHTALEYQVLDTTSGMLGSIDHEPSGASGYLRYADKPNSVYNFDSFGASMMFWAGWDDTNANPYHGNAGFKKRARCAMLAYGRHIQGTRLRRSEGENSLHHGLLGLAGTDTLGMGMHWGRVYGLLDGGDRAALLPAVVIQLCHVLNTNPTSTRNQDAHFLPFLYEAGRLWATQNQHLADPDMVLDIAEEYARWIVEIPSPWTGQRVAMQEARGFDGSYSGIQSYMLAAGWIASGDKFDPTSTDPNYGRDWTFLSDAIDRQYEHWSHFMAPADSGLTTAFAHDSDSRTSMGAVREQYSGAKVIGSLVSDMAARLALQDGSPRATDLLSPPGAGSNLDDQLPVATSAEAPRWRDEDPDPSKFNRPLARDGLKFDLVPLYVGGAGHLFGPGGPIDRGAEFPCEEAVASGIEIEEVDEAYIAINTPCYYAVIATRKPYSFYYNQAFDMYEQERGIEDYSDATGGGSIVDQSYPDGPNNSAWSRGEEIGGVGLSLFYDKTAPAPGAVIAARNWTPLTTHQLIGYTGGAERRRWADLASRTLSPITTTVSGGEVIKAELTISYELNSGSASTARYEVERKFIFHPSHIDVEVTLSVPPPSSPPVFFEWMDRFVENIPLEVSADQIGAATRSARLGFLNAQNLPWAGSNVVWDEWCADNWTTNEGLQHEDQEIGWIQKVLPVPTSSTPSTLNYSINPYFCQSPAMMSMPADGSQGSFERIVGFMRAYEIGSPRADVNRDGELTEDDLRVFLELHAD